MKNQTEIIIVLDRSGSMQSIKKETIKGFNALLKEQQSVAGEARITLVQFDHEYEPVYVGIDIREAAPLNNDTYMPRGTTALLDAMARTIVAVKKRHTAMPDEYRPAKVLFATITDGRENHSRKYSRKQVFDKITKMQSKHKWEFLFIGANQDAIEEASTLGIGADNAMNFVADSQGTEGMFFKVSARIADSRQ